MDVLGGPVGLSLFADIKIAAANQIDSPPRLND
jgi:hypothetical protein